ncbi:unnamed protein product [Rotaria socialis]|uniref:Innexin n=1 Tax=Rotaria socialis TaxID=392032 RepID=A0A818YRI2_9BILA|nr:unnamed protein product [Rotaria socialis]CAF3377804.1 unnamed protein product [Rotaria socialis]CAF3668256.1 unnamed protein product [Rotaria socialis]CAF3688176.1 unnamed protein product [Rotaria socialis]CAF3758893.1 unnamed protein product [Rotaria socialis]
MSLYLITEAFRKLGSPDIKNDDFYDRLSRKYSFILLGVSFLIISTSTFVGQPINCYTQNIPSSYVSYINSVCWIESSYYLPMDQPLPTRNEKDPFKILYYQWIPFILLTMMFFFYIPGFLWRNLNKSCGINTKMITKMVSDLDQLDSEKREKAIRTLAKHIDRALAYHRDYDHGLMYNFCRRFGFVPCTLIGRHSGYKLVYTYIFVKLLYIGNAIGQLLCLNLFMGDGFTFYGIKMIQRWLNGLPLSDEQRFPRISICEISIRALGDNIQRYNVQCLLPINIYNEKVFLVIWCWLVFVAIASIYGLFKWFFYLSSCARINFIRRFLKANDVPYCYRSSSSMGTDSNGDQVPIKRLAEFVNSYCRQDGILLLRIIKKNTNNVIAGEVVCALWDNWKIMPKIRSKASPESDNGGQIIGLGVKGSMKQNGAGEGIEKLLPPMSGILS